VLERQRRQERRVAKAGRHGVERFDFEGQRRGEAAPDDEKNHEGSVQGKAGSGVIGNHASLQQRCIAVFVLWGVWNQSCVSPKRNKVGAGAIFHGSSKRIAALPAARGKQVSLII
jgi:hypothetical protein